MRVLAVLLALATASASAGCFGDVSPVFVPVSKVASGWSQTTDNASSDVAGGEVRMITNTYSLSGQLVGSIHLLALTDVPFVDERKEMEKQVVRFAEDQEVTLTKVSSSSLRLDNGQKARAAEYTVEKQTGGSTVSGKAMLLSWDTGGFVGGAFGYATTEYAGPLLSQHDESAWIAAQSMVKAADW